MRIFHSIISNNFFILLDYFYLPAFWQPLDGLAKFIVPRFVYERMSIFSVGRTGAGGFAAVGSHAAALALDPRRAAVVQVDFIADGTRSALGKICFRTLNKHIETIIITLIYSLLIEIFICLYSLYTFFV